MKYTEFVIRPQQRVCLCKNSGSDDSGGISQNRKSICIIKKCNYFLHATSPLCLDCNIFLSHSSTNAPFYDAFKRHIIIIIENIESMMWWILLLPPFLHHRCHLHNPYLSRASRSAELWLGVGNLFCSSRVRSCSCILKTIKYKILISSS